MKNDYLHFIVIAVRIFCFFEVMNQTPEALSARRLEHLSHGHHLPAQGSRAKR